MQVSNLIFIFTSVIFQDYDNTNEIEINMVPNS